MAKLEFLPVTRPILTKGCLRHAGVYENAGVEDEDEIFFGWIIRREKDGRMKFLPVGDKMLSISQLLQIAEYMARRID
jgi:hypothetical protein